MTTPILCHLTWHCTDLDRTREFLEKLFGWEFTSQEENYLVFKPPGGPAIGLTEVERVVPGLAFVPQFAVDDLAAFCDRALQIDDGIIEDEGEIEGVGRFADLRDPDGVLFTVIEFVSSQ